MSVKERIQAVFILQKFVRMSRFLLPAYLDLVRKKQLSLKEESRLTRINSVYASFRANSETSVLLINSNILELIKCLYSQSMIDSEIKSSIAYNSFITESDSLINKWNRQLMN
jgi:hypothetical protein